MSSMKPKTLIIRTAGTNCDRELAYAFQAAGADTVTLHLNQLIERPGVIEEFQLIGFPGGFSYGDDIAAGRIFANRLRHRLLGPLRDAVGRGTAIIGICNGFQVLVKMGLLPDPQADEQQATLADNTSGRFIDRWVSLSVPQQTVCLWTQGLETIDLPIAHGEGRFVPGSDELLAKWSAAGQIALQYAGENPNGSAADAAGVCDASGAVLGLMPHPERFVHSTHHPNWSRMTAEALAQTPAGLAMFQNAVQHVAERMSETQTAGA